MAARYAEENGLEDVVFLNERKHLVETLKGTLYLVQNNQLRTPKLEAGCQDFALRTAFHHWLENEQTSYDLIEEDLNPFALQQSEALFVLSLEQGFQTISDYRKTQYSQEKITPLYTAFAASLD
jgi:branched-chain amino acid aminotransferase